MLNGTTPQKLAVLLVGGLSSLLVAVIAFGVVPTLTPVGPSQVLLIVLTLASGTYGAARLADRELAEYNTAKVTVDGIITQSKSGPLEPGPDEIDAGEVVDQIERADGDRHVKALIVELNTLGGMPVASSDIHEAASAFEGLTVAYAKDICASGGYWVACGCDEFFARDWSIVGSIGTNANLTKVHDLAEQHGITRERFAGGKYKDTLDPLKELSEDDREYFQGLVDCGHEAFVSDVADARDLDYESVSDTEARIYFASQALEEGLIDHIGTRRDLESLVADRIDVDQVEIEPFAPQRGLRAKLGVSAQTVAYAFGEGVANVVTDRNAPLVELRQ